MNDEIDVGDVTIEADGVPPVGCVYVMDEQGAHVGTIPAAHIGPLIQWLQEQLAEPG